MADEIKDTVPRFLVHWLATTVGFFLKLSIPVVKTWMDPHQPVAFPRWWAALMYAAIICLIGGGINGNLPIRTRELAKSLALGFGLNAAAALSKTTSA